MASQPGRRRLLNAIGLILVLAVLVWAVRTLDGHAIMSAFRQSRWELLPGAAVLYVVILAILAVRWRILLGAFIDVPYLTVASTLLLGVAASSVVPARGGEVVRIHLMARHVGARRALVAGTTMVDLAANSIGAIPLLLALPLLGGVPSWMRRAAVIAGAAICTLAIIIWASARSSPAGTHTGHWWKGLVAHVREGLSAIRSPGRAMYAAFLSALSWIVEAWIFWMVLHAFGSHGGAGEAVTVLLAVNIAIAAPSPPGNFGTMETGAALAAMAFGMPREHAVAFALACHALQLLGIWALTLPAIWWLRRARAPQWEDQPAEVSGTGTGPR